MVELMVVLMALEKAGVVKQVLLGPSTDRCGMKWRMRLTRRAEKGRG